RGARRRRAAAAAGHASRPPGECRRGGSRCRTGTRGPRRPLPGPRRGRAAARCARACPRTRARRRATAPPQGRSGPRQASPNWSSPSPSPPVDLGRGVGYKPSERLVKYSAPPGQVTDTLDTLKPASEAAGLELGSRRVAYTDRDAILYALAVGAAAEDLDLVFERDLRVLPTCGLGLGLWACDELGDRGFFS